MRPKQWRDQLFRGSRPNIRPLDLITDDGYGKDMGYLWAAYKTGSFEIDQGLSQEDFSAKIIDYLVPFDYAWMIEDRNAKFQDKIGPVGWVAASFNGWELNPHFDKFSWATPRNIVRANVAFLQMMRYRKEIGVLVLWCMKEYSDFYKRLKKYGVLNYVGKIPRGDRRGDKYEFYINGRKRA